MALTAEFPVELPSADKVAFSKQHPTSKLLEPNSIFQGNSKLEPKAVVALQ